jgi:hypothetical protein
LEKFDKMKGGDQLYDNVERERNRLYRYVINGIDAIIELKLTSALDSRSYLPIGTWNGQWEVGLPCRFGDQRTRRST